MARYATHLIARVTALNTSDVRRLIEVATETTAVDFRGREFCGIPDVGARGGLHVLAARAMAGFASPCVPTALLIRLHGKVWILAEGLVNIFVTPLAGLGAHVSRSRRGLGRNRCLGRQSCEEHAGDGRRDSQRSRVTRPGRAGHGRRWGRAGKSRRPKSRS